jgi:hypothetical protein
MPPIPFESSKPGLSVPHNSTGDLSSYKLISKTSIIERKPNPADLNNFEKKKMAIPLTMVPHGNKLTREREESGAAIRYGG